MIRCLVLATALVAMSLPAQTVASVKVEAPPTLNVSSAPTQLVAMATFTDGLVAVWAPISVAGLHVVSQPATGIAGTALKPFKVQVMDTSGRAAAVKSAAIRVTAASGPAGIALGTMNRSTTLEGRATFPDLTVNKAGTYTFTFTMATTQGNMTVTSGPVVVKCKAAGC